MARGNRLERIVRPDEDGEIFEETLKEVVGRTGWRVYAYALIGNHYHLVFKKPKANLVEGMTWFQNTVTKRHNARNKLRGRLFSGRYKVVLVEENDYLSTLIQLCASVIISPFIYTDSLNRISIYFGLLYG